MGKNVIKDASLVAVVEKLCAGGTRLAPIASRIAKDPPSQSALIEVLEGLRSVLFPEHFGLGQTGEVRKQRVSSIIKDMLPCLEEQICRGFAFGQGEIENRLQEYVSHCTTHLRSRLPELQRLVMLDVEAAFTGDPAAKSRNEIVFSYPGVKTICHHRIAHELFLLNVPLVPRIMSEYSHGITGIDIHPGATIGESFFIDHGTGVVIGETCEIGRNVRIYQGATLGAKSFPLGTDGRPVKGILRHPIVEDNVIIYSGATILGRTRLGRNSIIGANAWVTRDVRPGAVITRYHGQKDDLLVDFTS